MHIKWIGGRAYCYESERIGGRVTSRCQGRGVPGGLISWVAAFCKRKKADERAARRMAKRRADDEARLAKARAAELKEQAKGLEAFGRELAEYGREVDAAVTDALHALGYHRPKRGAWRRRMGSKAEEGGGRSELRKLIPLARKGDELAAGRLAEILAHRETHGAGELEEVAECNLLGLVPSTGQSGKHRAHVEARLEEIRRKLAPPGSDPVVELLATRAALDHLHVAFWEEWCILVWGEVKRINKGWMMFQRNLDAATARYQRSLLAVAKARRLALPVVVNQLNVAVVDRPQVIAMTPRVVEVERSETPGPLTSIP